jgi:hypothetical protein
MRQPEHYKHVLPRLRRRGRRLLHFLLQSNFQDLGQDLTVELCSPPLLKRAIGKWIGRRAALAPELASSLFFINEWLIFETLSVLTLHLSKHIFSRQTDLTSQTTRIRLPGGGYSTSHLASLQPLIGRRRRMKQLTRVLLIAVMTTSSSLLALGQGQSQNNNKRFLA